MYRRQVTPPILLLATLLLAACAQAATPSPRAPAIEEPTPTLAPTGTAVPSVADLETLPTPTQLPDYHWAQLLGRDDIAPIYDPTFVSAEAAGYQDAELVMGVEIDGEAKAYPIGLLNQREMVNDELAGIPILVTW